MTYGYIRVSSDRQTVENQRFEITNWCKNKKIKIDGWIEESISGTKDYDKRKLGKLLKKIKKDDLIICSELSRLGRNLFMIMEILNICMDRECKVWTIKDNYRLGDDITSKVLAFAFGLSAEIERNLISQRTKEALARKKAEGVILGRPKGRALRVCLSGKEDLIERLFFKERMSKSAIAKRLKVDRGTVASFMINYMGIINNKPFKVSSKEIEKIISLYANGLSYEEIAKNMEIPEGVVRRELDKNISNQIVRKEFLKRRFMRSGAVILSKIQHGVSMNDIAIQYNLKDEELKAFVQNNDVYN